jgi:putative membrane protein
MSIRRLMATAVGGLVIAFGAGATSPLQAQDDVGKDSEFIREVAADHLLEIRLGTIAQNKATNPAVKQFGERMVNDHNSMLQQWRALVSKSGFPFQPGLRDEQEEEVERLEKVSGTEFDRAYMTSMIQDHQNAVAKFQGKGQSANSAQVRELVNTGLPVLQQHLTLATQVGSQVGATNVAVTPTPTPPAPTPTPTPPAPTPTAQPPAPTQNPPVAAQPTPAVWENLKPDMTFIREALQDNLLEIRMGQMAEKKSNDAAVKQYAQRVISDHNIMQNQWIALAARNGTTLRPGGLGPRHRAKADRLEKLSGRKFDRAYMTTEVQSHQDYVEYFSKEGRATRSSQVRDLAANDLRSLELHSSEARDVAKELGVNVAAALRARKTAAYRNN